MGFETAKVRVGDVEIGGGGPLALIAGPCVIESREGCLAIAKQLAELASGEGIPLIFKASYDKANRSSRKSFRGPGLEDGLSILAEVRKRHSLPVLTDVHAVREVGPASEVADVLQLPAFLCRQSDLAAELGRSGKAVNVKKGQFLSPWDIANVIDKVVSAGNERVMVTERGFSFGYNNLVVDMRSLPIMARFGRPVVFDATHSVQLPGGEGDKSGGDADMAPYLARAAVAAGCDAVFIETHSSPEDALCDGTNMIPVSGLKDLWRMLCRIRRAVADETGAKE